MLLGVRAKIFYGLDGLSGLCPLLSLGVRQKKSTDLMDFRDFMPWHLSFVSIKSVDVRGFRSFPYILPFCLSGVCGLCPECAACVQNVWPVSRMCGLYPEYAACVQNVRPASRMCDLRPECVACVQNVWPVSRMCGLRSERAGVRHSQTEARVIIITNF